MDRTNMSNALETMLDENSLAEVLTTLHELVEGRSQLAHYGLYLTDMVILEIALDAVNENHQRHHIA